jgi:hypothetical protein
MGFNSAFKKLINLNFRDRFSKKYSNTKLHGNPPGGSRVVPCGQTVGLTDGWTDRETDRTKLIVAFRNFWKRAYTRIKVCNLQVHFNNINGVKLSIH